MPARRPVQSVAKASADDALTPPLRRLGRLTGRAAARARSATTVRVLESKEHLRCPSLARVAAVHRGGLELITDAGPRAGFVTGRLRHAAATAVDLPAVGDYVTHDPESGAVHAVRERTSALVRAARDGREPQVLAANVDLVVVVASLTRELILGRIERMLTLAADAPADALVVLSKADLDPDPAARVAEVRAALAGAAPVLPVSTRRRHRARRRRGAARPGRDRRAAGRLRRRQDHAAQPAGGRRAGDRPDPRGRRPRPPHDHVARARAAGGRRRRHRHARAQAPAHLGAGARARERVLRRRGARPRLPLRRLLATPASPAARWREALGDGRLAPERLAAHEQLGREQAWAESRRDERARRERKDGDAAHPPRAAADPAGEEGARR